MAKTAMTEEGKIYTEYEPAPMPLTHGMLVDKVVDGCNQACVITDPNGFIPSMTIPLNGERWTDEDWENWLELTAYQMRLIFHFCNLKELRKVILEEIHFRANNIVWSPDPTHEPPEDVYFKCLQWKVALKWALKWEAYDE